ncbi:hypothetical protein FZEAL_2624 [Fusarium zealandicum]|uniref:Complex I intermediate-associated protein 84 n=1 Tax=Fusarium zealandicum TaxID=1053134 RepID=A0A8H4UR26_9HYPO|nr:hypothetical protein FZEAL_2624 [Fusarium zealandicum]
MRAQLARHARRLLVQHARSPSCAVYSAPLRRRCLPRPIHHSESRRTFFDNLFQKAPREVRQPEFEPGWMNIMVWRSRMLDNLRPPPTPELVQAWKAFFEGKLSSRMPLNGSQAMQCHRLLDYLLKQDNEPTQSKLEAQHFNIAFTALETLRPRERTQNHLDLVKRLYTALSSGELPPPESDSPMWVRFVSTLSIYGGSKEALEILHDHWEDVIKYGVGKQKSKKPLLSVAEGFAREGREQDLVELANYAEKNGIPYKADLQAVLVTFFAERSQVAETKYWFEKPTATGRRSARVYPLIASFAARNGLKDWAVPFFLELGDMKLSKGHWDSLLQAILIIGKGLKHVEAMMSHMADSSGDIEANTVTINGLLRAAVDMKDPLLAEDILSLAEKRGIQLDGETQLTLMKMRLQASYLPGVHAAYKRVAHLEPWQRKPDLWWEFSQLLNQYLCALCSQKIPDFKLIGEVIELAEENQVHLEPETVASLCIRFLENEQQFDVMDVLSVHAFQFSAAEREVIQDAFVKFCLDHETSTSRAWSGYQLLRQFFQDLSFEHRVKLMEVFFERKRPDMAAHIFGHMRQHRNSDYHPKRETYIACFEGFARYPDAESLEIVYNMLKMDTIVEPNTKLYTSLILAHTACDKPLQAMDLWHEITTSREGPSYASLEAIFWALEHTPRGSRTADNIWKRIQKMDVDIPPQVYNAYVGAIAGSAEEEKLKDTIMRMAAVTESGPNAMTLGVAFNALPGQKLQANFKGWAKMRYPDAWAELEKKGTRMNSDSLCQFKLNRIFKA